MRPPNLEEFKRGKTRPRDYSPDYRFARMAGAPDYLQTLVKSGVVVGMGHTKASLMRFEPPSTRAPRCPHIWAMVLMPHSEDGKLYLGSACEDRLAPGSLSTEFTSRPLFCEPPSSQRCGASAACDGRRYARDMQARSLPARPVVELQEDSNVVLKGGERLAGSALRMDEPWETCPDGGILFATH